MSSTGKSLTAFIRLFPGKKEKTPLRLTVLSAAELIIIYFQ